MVSRTSTVGTSKFTLPKDWSVMEVPRQNGGVVDKYYHDPETGLQFRSLKEVERYITKGLTPSKLRAKKLKFDHHREKNSGSPNAIVASGKNSGSPDMTVSSGKNSGSPDMTVSSGKNSGSPDMTVSCGKNSGSPDMTVSSGKNARSSDIIVYSRRNSRSSDMIVSSGKNSDSSDMIVSNSKMLDFEEDKDDEHRLANVSGTSISPSLHSKLPDGWVVEEVPRRNGGYTDKYYYEPGTGQKFRSLLAVQKHIAELEAKPLSVVLEELKENSLPLSKAFKLNSCIKNYGSYNSWKKSTSRKEDNSSSVSPPSKINWVIADSGGDSWNAFVGDKLVPDSTKEQWDNTFMLGINNKHNTTVSG